MKRSPVPDRNLLELKPVRNLAWERNAEGRVVLVIPKFRNRYVAKWFTPMLAKPNIRVKLDEKGSFLWQRCDGQTTVAEMSRHMSETFGESEDAMVERIVRFLGPLIRDHFVSIDPDEPTTYAPRNVSSTSLNNH